MSILDLIVDMAVEGVFEYLASPRQSTKGPAQKGGDNTRVTDKVETTGRKPEKVGMGWAMKTKKESTVNNRPRR